jgi:hypothetical protein
MACAINVAEHNYTKQNMDLIDAFSLDTLKLAWLPAEAVDLLNSKINEIIRTNYSRFYNVCYREGIYAALNSYIRNTHDWNYLRLLDNKLRHILLVKNKPLTHMQVKYHLSEIAKIITYVAIVYEPE